MNKELNKELNKESHKESNKELIEIINPKKDEDTTDWYDKNKFKKILTTIDSNKFNHKNKVGKLKFNDINNLINNIKNNTISETDAQQKLNALDKIRKVETKNKRLINGQKILLNLFDDLIEAIFNNNNKIVNEDNNKIVNEDNNDNDNDDDDDDDYGCDNYDEITVKEINNNFKKIDETKSFEDQIDILKKIPWLNEYWDMDYYEDNKETNLRLFKLKFAHIFNDVDDNLFKEIFGLTSVKLADKLINITSKEENQMFINDIEINRDKIFEQDKYGKFVIQPTHKRGDLLDVVRVILKFNETIQLNLT